jgi:23S rRNA pseudouridine1911/1915/1917 synthase
VQTGDSLEVAIPDAPKSALQPLDLRLEILFQDDDVAVINKPAGLVVHPAAGHAQDTLVNALIGQIKNLSMGFGEHRPGIVHRLDKDTSGLLVIAKNNQAQEFLAKQFKDKTVHRIYWALVYGEPAKRFKTIESLLARHPTNRKKFSSQEVGKRAVTHYKTLKTKSGVSLLQCQLETGRTHQIRVHLSELGHPIIGDHIYGSHRWLNRLNKSLQGQVESLNRIGLHACELGFTHPRTLEVMRFSTPWPSDLYDLVTELDMFDV